MIKVIIETKRDTTMDLIERDHTTEIAQRLASFSRNAHGALSPNTERALRADIRVFSLWCAQNGLQALPATPETVASFIDEIGAQKKPATLRRYVSSISTFHRAAGLESPSGAQVVRLALKRQARSRGTRQRQAAPLTRRHVDQILGASGTTLTDRRNKALIAVAYDTLARRSELVALNVSDFEPSEDGSGTVMINRSKADQDGLGQARYIAADTMTLVRAWLDAADITDGPIFRRMHRGARVSDKRLSAGSVATIFRQLAKRAGLDPRAISGHSSRVGAAQDAIAAGLEMPMVMQMGGWKSPSMVARYSERLLASRSGSAKLAAMQGRTAD